MMNINDFIIDDFNPSSLAEKIASRMKAKRIILNITQMALASRSGVSLGSIKRFESKHQISLQSLIKLSIVLDASLEFQQLFPVDQYTSIAEVLKLREQRTRSRARRA